MSQSIATGIALALSCLVLPGAGLLEARTATAGDRDRDSEGCRLQPNVSGTWYGRNSVVIYDKTEGAFATGKTTVWLEIAQFCDHPNVLRARKRFATVFDAGGDVEAVELMAGTVSSRGLVLMHDVGEEPNGAGTTGLTTGRFDGRRLRLQYVADDADRSVSYSITLMRSSRSSELAQD